jgi:hypothetical protein
LRPGIPLSKTYTFEKRGFFILRGTSIPEDKEIFFIPTYNLKNVTFKITYNDQKIGGLFGILFKNTIGNDQIDIIITDPEDSKHTKSIRGSATGVEIPIKDNINPMIDLEPIEAETRVDAMDILESRFMSKWKDEYFGIQATLNIGEKLRPLLRFREKLSQDSFKVEMIFYYYYYDLGEPVEPPKNPGTGGKIGDYKSTPYNSLINTGFH